MKLTELKTALIEQFFKNTGPGVELADLTKVYEALDAHLKLKIRSALTEQVRRSEISSDPSKAFKKFTDGRQALLLICEDDEIKKLAIFAAVRQGKKVAFSDLTAEGQAPRTGDLAAIKDALRQAKNLNDDAYFSVLTENSPLVETGAGMWTKHGDGYSTEASNTRGEKLTCPKCSKALDKKHFSAEKSGEGEIESWKTNCGNCRTNLTIWND